MCIRDSTVKGTSVHKVKVYDPDGTTLYSTEPSQIGAKRTDKPALASAMAGQVASTLSYRDKFNSMEGEVFSRQLLSTYVPILDADGHVSLIFEIYDELVAKRERRRRRRHDQERGHGKVPHEAEALALEWLGDHVGRTGERVKGRWKHRPDRTSPRDLALTKL